MELVLCFVALALVYVGHQIGKFTKVYALLTGKYIEDDEAKKLYSNLNVYFTSNEETVSLIIGKDKYRLNAYEEYVVRENLLESVTTGKVKVNTKSVEVLKLVHSKLYAKEINNKLQ